MLRRTFQGSELCSTSYLSNMKIRALKYCYPFMMFVYSWIAFTFHGWVTFIPVIWSYFLIPALELFTKPDPVNVDAAEEEMVKADKVYDYILYAVVPLHYASLIY